MKTTVEINSKVFNRVGLVFGLLLVGAIVFALCTGDLALLRTMGY